jgi:hypothetical protein
MSHSFYFHVLNTACLPSNITSYISKINTYLDLYFNHRNKKLNGEVYIALFIPNYNNFEEKNTKFLFLK